ncbi:MAG: hypothetical protein HQL70_08280 [Magnetococcales bacterium]|nr:hypothetical protein [Magnetococcales bacterium]
MSSLANLQDPKKRASFAQDVVYEVDQMESPVTVSKGECSKEDLSKTAKSAETLTFDYSRLIDPN